jgi:antitoxin FitA
MLAMGAANAWKSERSKSGRCSLKRRAARHGRSAEAEVREILRFALAVEVEITFDDLAAEVRALIAGRNHTPAEMLLRESRDES